MPTRPFLSLLLAFAALSLFRVTLPTAAAGPQHWGFGFSYLAAIEEVAGARRLIVYEPPLIAQDVTWPSRWLDRTTVLTDVPSGGLAIGDFFPAAFTNDYLTTIRQISGQLTMKLYAAPEFFSTRAWTLKSTSTGVAVTGTFLGAAAGDLRGVGKDQLAVVLQDGGSLTVAILNPPSTLTGTTWTKVYQVALPGVTGTYLGVACGDFWGEGRDYLALATGVGGATHLSFYAFSAANGSFTLVATDTSLDLPALQMNGLTAADYEKDGFDVLTLVPAGGDTFELRVAPAKGGQAYDPGPEYTGRALSGQWMPGNGGASSLVVMRGTFGASGGSRVGFAAGRVFGYINSNMGTRFSVANSPDAQIAFAHRSPRKDERLPYGWPNPDEEVTYEFNLNNNGSIPIVGGNVHLKVWVARPNRNADTDPATCDTPDYDFAISETLPAYNSSSPTYVARSVTFSWPYYLTPAGPGATWQKLDLEWIGELWNIAVVEYANDANLRNNRYEMALHGVTFHPILRNTASLADRQPTVQGDPPGKEYLCRKIADAVQAKWERSQTLGGEAVPQRLWFDSYQLGWPDDLPEPQRSQLWADVQAKYEGWRELDQWWGYYQTWERFDWHDSGSNELHETGHLFHPIGDLYQYYVSPVFTGPAKMADGTPVQLRTYVWPPDSFGTGYTRMTWPACEMMKQILVGVRNASIDAWWTLASDHVFIRVLDRHGNPVSGAQVKAWGWRQAAPMGAGVTGADGRWEITPLFGTATTDVFGRKHYYSGGDFNGMQFYTVSIGAGAYQEAAVLGADETAAHSQHTRMGHSFTDPTSWSWDFRTNYDAAAPAPSFTLTAAVQGSTVNLGATGASGGTYRLYRRWEPTYVRTLVGEYAAAGTTTVIPADLAAADSFASGRFRAIYEVTQGGAGAESLPRTVQVTGLIGARGVTARADGKLLVAANAGIANPFGQVFDGTTPYEELFFHFRFGHTAHKVVPSRRVTGRYYVSLAYSDMDPDYRFDLVEAPTSAPYGYDVRNEIHHLVAKAFSTTAPYWIQCYSAADAAHYQPGDQVKGSAASPRVTQVSGDTLYLDGPAFSSGQANPGFTGNRLAGKPGSNATYRELSSARGLDTILAYDWSEYIVLADTGNRRVVVWDDQTGYVTHWQSPETEARPAAIAAHPLVPGKFFMLDRRSGASKVYLFTLDLTTPELYVDDGYPLTVNVQDGGSVAEMGLAAAVDPITGALRLLMTDAASNRVVEWTQGSGGAWQHTATYTQAQGVYAGSANLSQPSDVAYVATDRALRWYAVDGTNRLVFLGERVVPSIPGDFDDDGDVDGADWQRFAPCLAGPGITAPPAGCSPADFAKADLDGDGDVDVRDATEFQQRFAGGQ